MKQLDRRTTQEAYVRALEGSACPDWPLDYQTIVESIFPLSLGTPIPLRKREMVRSWIEELISCGILIRDPAQDRSKGDFFILNPGTVDGRQALERFAELRDTPSPDLTVDQRALMAVLLAGSAGAFYVIYTRLSPPSLLSGGLGALAVLTTVLAAAGWRIRTESALSDVLWTRRALLPSGILCGGLCLAVLVSYLFPFEVTIPPGASLTVDGRPLCGAPTSPMRARTCRFVAWGQHDFAVTKRWFEDPKTCEPESRLSLSWPLHRSGEVHLVSRLGVSLEPHVGYEDPADSPKVPALRRKLGRILLATRYCLDASQDSELEVCDSAPAVEVSATVEHDFGTGDHYLILECRGPSRPFSKRLGRCSFGNDDDFAREAREVRSRLLDELALDPSRRDSGLQRGFSDWLACNPIPASTPQGALQQVIVLTDVMSRAQTRPGLKELAQHSSPSVIAQVISRATQPATGAAPESLEKSFDAINHLAVASLRAMAPDVSKEAEVGLRQVEAQATTQFGKATAADIASCPQTGAPGTDAASNALKNRTDDAVRPRTMTIAEVRNLTQLPGAPRAREAASLAQLHEIQVAGEGTAVQVEGYLVRAQIAGPEACNCYLLGATNNDFRLCLGASPDTPRSDCIVAEITPRKRDASLAFPAIAGAVRERVRLTGWLFMDFAQRAQMGQSRASLWEIHPVTKIEVYQGASRNSPAHWESLSR